jgi:GxxExxY protein
MITQKYLNELTYDIIGYAIDIHKELGPGLLESVYEKCLCHLLLMNGFNVQQQQNVPLVFQGIHLDCDLRFDMLVNDLVVVELKTVESILSIHEAQLLTYLKLLNKPKGVLINFNCTNISTEGKKTLVTDLYRNYPLGY